MIVVRRDQVGYLSALEELAKTHNIAILYQDYSYALNIVCI